MLKLTLVIVALAVSGAPAYAAGPVDLPAAMPSSCLGYLHSVNRMHEPGVARSFALCSSEIDKMSAEFCGTRVDRFRMHDLIRVADGDAEKLRASCR